MPFVVAPEEKAELACTFAALILHDDGLKVDGDSIGKLLQAANVQIEPYWPKMYASMLANKKIGDLIAASASGGGGGDAAPAAAAGGKADAKKDDKAKGGDDKKGGDKGKGGDKAKDKKPKDEEPEAEEAADMGFSLFD